MVGALSCSSQGPRKSSDAGNQHDGRGEDAHAEVAGRPDATDAAPAPDATDSAVPAEAPDAAHDVPSPSDVPDAPLGIDADGGASEVSPAMVLDGQKWLQPCGPDQSTTNLVCQTPPPTGTVCRLAPANPTVEQYITMGQLDRDDTLTLGGPPGTVFDVTVRIRGIAEPKHYQGGARGALVAGAPAQNPGWYVGGEPFFTGYYSTYLLWISGPVVSETRHLGGGDPLPGQYYWLNAIDNFEAHFTYPVDYTVTFPVAAGATLRLLVDDGNCSRVKNCDNTSVELGRGGLPGCNPSVIPDLPASDGIDQPYQGQFLVMHVISVAAR